MRPQDVVMLLKILTYGNSSWTQSNVASSLLLSASEVTAGMERNRIAGLVNQSKNKVNKLALREFLIYGLKYVFPPQVGHPARGIATAHSAPPISDHIVEGREVYVWPYFKGTRKGNAIVPLYDKIPKVAESDLPLYEYLVIVDTLRIGKKREIEIAINELDKRLEDYAGH